MGANQTSDVDGPLPLLWLLSPSLSLGWSDGDNCHLWTHVTFVLATAASLAPRLTICLSAPRPGDE